MVMMLFLVNKRDRGQGVTGGQLQQERCRRDLKILWRQEIRVRNHQEENKITPSILRALKEGRWDKPQCVE